MSPMAGRAGRRGGAAAGGARAGGAAAASSGASAAAAGSAGSAAPLLLRAARGEAVERPPAWMMRQAGRYMRVYQDLCKVNTSFRERSETPDLVVDISLQPLRAFRPDGVILFSDILTPFIGMDVDFDFKPGVGPLIQNPVGDAEGAAAVRPVDLDQMGFVGESLRTLRGELAGTDATLLGFVGAPFTLATYLVEGGTSRSYLKIKEMMMKDPQLLHGLLSKLADSMADYVGFQADSGAQVVQIFDSWAGHLTPRDFDEFSRPYLQRIVDRVKETHPELPLILYISGSAGLLERLPSTGIDIVSVDHSVDMADARTRLGDGVGVQGNLDPAVLVSGTQGDIERRVDAIVEKARGVRHILNLGHGVMPNTPEESVAQFFEACRTTSDRLARV